MSLRAVAHGVTSINGENGAITLTSPDSSITIGGSGSTITLETAGGGGSPGGSNTDVQYNNAGVLGGNSGFTYDGSGNVVVGASLAVDFLKDKNSNTSFISLGSGALGQYPSGIVSLDWINHVLYDASNVGSVLYNYRELHDQNNFVALEWQHRILTADDGVTNLIDWSNASASANYYFSSGKLIGDGSGLSGATGVWTPSGGDIYNNNPGGVGIGQRIPLAQLHVSPTISNPNGFTSVIQPGTTGFAFGSGSKSYNLYAQNTPGGVFSSAITTTFTEPSSTDYDPANGNCSFNTGATGYTASGYDFYYNIWALYNSNTQIGLGFTASGSISDPNDGSTYGINVNWTAPTGINATPSAYLVQILGNNPPTGQFQIVGATSFVDDNSSWTSPPTTTALNYSVGLSWFGGGPPTDNYIVNNASNGTWLNEGGGTSANDDATWTSTPIVVTPTGNAKSLIVDGSFEDHNGVSYSYPSSNAAGYLYNNGSGNLDWEFVQLSGITAGSNINRMVFSSGSGNLTTTSNFTFDGINLALQAALMMTPYVDGSTSGNVNDYATNAETSFKFNNNIGFTGFAQPLNGKLLILQAPAGITLFNENTGSSNLNRIRTPSGTDLVVPTDGVALLIYDYQQNRWKVISSGKPDVTVLANTWNKKQIIQLTTTQLQLGYDASHFTTFTIDSTGSLTIAQTGTSPKTTFSQGVTFASSITLNDNQNIQLGTSGGSKIGTSTGQKLGFWNVTPIIQPANSTAIDTLLTNTGLRASGGTANFATKITAPASTTSAASLNVPSGTAPTSPNDGDHWYDGTHLQARIGSTTYQIDRQAISGSFSGTGTATTAFTVTIPTQANNTYKVIIEPTDTLAAALQYISAKTTTSFTVTYLTGLTGTVAFDWAVFP